MSAPTIVRDCAIVAATSLLLGLGYNAVQPRGIELVASEPYQILVPCPVETGEAPPIEAAAVRWGDPAEVLIDVRSAAEHTEWTAPGAKNVPYDFLDPVGDDVIDELIRTVGERVVVFGDGQNPDSGHELGAELSGHGVRSVFYVRGGAPAVRAHLEAIEEVAP